MRGSDARSGKLFSYVDLEQRLPSRHPLQAIRMIVNEALADMDIFHEEIFGPVLTVHGVNDRADVLEEIARRPSPLGLYVFTQSRATADWYIDHTQGGSSAINNIASQTPVPTIPFGGLNHSGIGRLGGHAGFCEF